jgi:hypothetical protein
VGQALEAVCHRFGLTALELAALEDRIQDNQRAFLEAALMRRDTEPSEFAVVSWLTTGTPSVS